MEYSNHFIKYVSRIEEGDVSEEDVTITYKKGKNNKKTVLWDNIEKSPEWDYQNKQDLAEEIRIFYVGFTRARDYLILPYADKDLSVINRIWNKDLEELNLLDWAR